MRFSRLECSCGFFSNVDGNHSTVVEDWKKLFAKEDVLLMIVDDIVYGTCPDCGLIYKMASRHDICDLLDRINEGKEYYFPGLFIGVQC